MVLKPDEAKKYYDRFGRKQDSQSFYEDKATDALIAHADFGEAAKVFEFGCGTGRFAQKLLKNHLPASAVYKGCDLSGTMVGLARQRLAAFGARAQVSQSDGAIRFPLADDSMDRIVCAYVLDLLSETDIADFFREAYRTLRPRGKIGLAGLTNGTTRLSRLVTAVWSTVFRIRPSLVGGCRPIQVRRHLDAGLWRIQYHRVVTAFGVPSEVLVAGIGK